MYEIKLSSELELTIQNLVDAWPKIEIPQKLTALSESLSAQLQPTVKRLSETTREAFLDNFPNWRNTQKSVLPEYAAIAAKSESPANPVKKTFLKIKPKFKSAYHVAEVIHTIYSIVVDILNLFKG